MKRTEMLTLFATLFLLLARIGNAASTCTNLPYSTELAPWYCSEINQQVQDIWSQWEPAVIAAITLAFLIAGIIFMLGASFKIEKLRDFGIGELYEATATTAIATIFMVISAILFGVIPTFITGPLNPFNTSLTYINNIIVATQGLITSMYNTVMLDSFYGSVTLQTSIGKGATGNSATAGNIAKPLGAILNPLADAITSLFIIPAQTVSSLLVDGLLALTAEFYFIVFFMYIAIPVFLIPGILMRAIFPLRNVGGFMVAIAFSFFIVMPILFSVAFALTSTGTIQSLNTAAQEITANGQGTQSQTNAASSSSPLVTEVAQVQSNMGGYFLSVLFYPALILALTYMIMREIAEFIGGLAQTSGKLGLI